MKTIASHQTPGIVRAPAAGSPASPIADATAAQGKHLAYLDGLRGIAILMVVAIHASLLVTALPQPLRDLSFYGVRGVQLFFLVSGFTLTTVHAGRPLEPLNFAARRFFRIAPMFYLGIGLYLLLSAVTTMPLPTRAASVGGVVATALFIHGWLPGAINTVVPGGWSIAAEAMFYVAFPAVLALVSRRRLFAVAVLASYVVAGIANIALRKLIGGPDGANFALYFWVVQFPAFLGGCWLATLPRPGASLRRIAPWLLTLAAIGLVADSQARGHSNLLVAIAILTLLVWASSVARPGWLESRPLVFLGRISFSVYIVHFAVLGMLQPVAGAAEAALGATLAFGAIFALALLIAGVLAAGTFRWIEQPIIARTRQVGRKRST